MVWQINDPMYGSSVLVIQCVPDKLRSTYEKVRGDHYDFDLWDYDKPKLMGGFKSAAGYCFYEDSTSVVIWVSPEADMASVLAHEFTHAAEIILRCVGVPPKGEALAYFIGFLHDSFRDQ